MNIDNLTKRIDYTGKLLPTLKVLTDLQRKFIHNIPFENLDIHLDIPMDLSEDYLFNKIVDRKRGGLCFENNSLFYTYLRHIGFEVQFVGAEMFQSHPTENINHMALLVSVDDNSYLVDVGNGRFYGKPILVEAPEWVKGEDSNYCVNNYIGYRTLLYLDPDGKLQPRYSFYSLPKQLEDFIQPSIYTQTSPDSIFKQKTLVTILKPDGRFTLSGTKLIFTKNGNQEVKALPSAEDYRNILPKFFNIFLEEKQLDYLIDKINKKQEINLN